MPFAPATVLRLVDSIAVVLSQAYQSARTRLASTASPVLRMTLQRDHAFSQRELLRRELDIFRQSPEPPAASAARISPRATLGHPPTPTSTRGWNITRTARRFVVHPNTIRSWIKAAEGRGRVSLLADAIPWNRIDDDVRWSIHQLRRLCPEPELGTRTLARHLLRSGIELSRSSAQRIPREPRPVRPPQPRRPAMALPVGEKPDRLLTPQTVNHVWHMDLVQIRLLWFCFTAAVILDGFSRKILGVRVYRQTPPSRQLAILVRGAVGRHGSPAFLITDHGAQFRLMFRLAMKKLHIRHVRGRVRAPYLNGKIERCFRTLRIWWRLVLTSDKTACLQRRLEDFQHWYNHHRPHGALHGLTPDEAWKGILLPAPVPIRARDSIKPRIGVRRFHCRGDPLLPVIQIHLRHAA